MEHKDLPYEALVVRIKKDFRLKEERTYKSSDRQGRVLHKQRVNKIREEEYDMEEGTMSDY